MASPSSLGRYELTTHIARGGMADVFAAADTLLDRRVAVKILHHRYAEADAFVARFRKEAQAAANLSHPNIVSIYDWGEEDRTYFIVMELVKGRSLRDIMKSEGKLLPRRAAEIAAEIAVALEVAHRNRVIHRDIKPANILLTTDGVVKVTDFGVARAGDDSLDLTKTGAVIGTATYFSPEQARGDPADERSDIYSLGVVLYEMLAGRPPFRGDNPVSVAYQHVINDVIPPSRFNPDVPAGLEEIVMRSLEKDPARRYQSAAAFHRDLLLTLQGKPQPASASMRPQPSPTRSMRRQELPPPTAPTDETYRRLHARPRQPSQLPFVITAIVLAGGVVFGVYLLLNSLSNETTTTTVVEAVTIEVPDVAGRPDDEARQILQEAGFRVTEEEEASDLAAGTVIRTEPVPGEERGEAPFVEMVVSSGPARIQVPTVVGSTQNRAIGQLEGQGFAFSVRTSSHESVGVGLVISQTPSGEATAPRGSTVELVVSAGPQPIEMPRVIGLSRDRAEGRLEGLGLEVETTTTRDNNVEMGLVISQSPPPGADINPGWAVQIVVSEGSDEIELVEVSGLPLDEARALLEEAGMVAVVRQESNASLPAGIVIRTEPPGGAMAPAGSEVTVVESTGPEFILVPDLTGATPEDAEAMLAELGLFLEVGNSRASVDTPELDGRIARQAPDPGTEVFQGETVLAVLGEYTVEVVEPGSEGNAEGDSGGT